MLPPISSSIKLILWVVVGIASLGFAILVIVLESNLRYFIRRRGARPSRKPLILWVLFWLAATTMVFGTAVVSSAPDIDNSETQTSPTITSDIPIPVPTQASYPIDWLYSRVGFLSSSCNNQNDWLSFHKNYLGSNYICDFMSYPLKKQWEIQGSDEGEFNSPIVVNDVIYAVDGDGNVYSINAINGEVLWKSQIDWVQGSGQSLAYYSGKLYLAAYSGVVYAINSNDGTIEWTYSTNETLNSSPIVQDNKVFVAGWAGGLYSIDTMTGTLLWRTKVGEVYRTDFAANGGMLYIFSRDGNLHAIKVDTGEEAWTTRVADGYGNGRTPAFFDSVLYIAGDQKIYAIDSLTGKTIWSQEADGLFDVESITVDDYMVYVPMPTKYKLVALDRLSGQIRWEQIVDKFLSAYSPIVNTRHVITRAYDELLFINKYNGSIDWTQAIGANSMMPYPIGAISNGILVVNVKNKLVAYATNVGRVMTIGTQIGIWDPEMESLIRVDPPIEVDDCNPRGQDSLICVGLTDGQVNVYEIAILDGSPQLLSSFKVDVKPKSLMVLSSDSKFVAFVTGLGYMVSEYIDHGDLYILDITNSKQYHITSEFCGISKSLGWSPDSQWLIYPLCVGKGEFGADASSLIRVRNDGTDELGLVNLDTNFPFLDWSPDGLWVAYSHSSLEVITPDGSQKIKLDSHAGEIQWQSTGMMLFYNSSDTPVDQEGIYVQGPDMGTGKWIVTYPGRIYVDGTPYGVSLDENYIALLDIGSQSNYIVNIFNVRSSEIWKVIEFGERFEENIQIIKWIP